MQGRIPDIFLGFQFQKDRLKSGSSGGQMFGFPIDLAHRLYNSLLLSHKPWFGGLPCRQRRSRCLLCSVRLPDVE